MMHVTGPIPVVINKAAGRGVARAGGAVLGPFRDAGIAVEPRLVEPSRIAAVVRSLARRGASVVGVAGGDGSVCAAAGVLAGTDTALLPIPVGTLNHFARRVGIGTVAAAVRAAGEGEVVPIAVGEVDGRTFLNTALFGLYADIVRYRERGRRFLPKWPAAGVAMAVALARLPRMEMVIDLGERRIARATPLVMVGLGRGSVPFSHLAAHGAGARWFEVAVLRARGRVDMLRTASGVAWRMLFGRLPGRIPGLELYHARSVVLRAPRVVDVTLDGEVGWLSPPIALRVRDEALRIVSVPRDEAGGA